MLLSPRLSFIWPPLLISTLISISSPRWLVIWAFLEINIFTFLIFLSTPSTPITRETRLKYLVIQATSSSILILSAIVCNRDYQWLARITIVVTILFKLGAAPFHQWFVSISKALPTKTFILLLTWQKIIPLILVSSYLTKTKIIPVIVILNALVGALGGLIQTTLHPLLCYSSINHIAWILIAIKRSSRTFIIYAATYFSMLLMLIKTSLTLTPLNHWRQQAILKSKPHSNRAVLNILSLAGIPPLIGFIIKWMVIRETNINLIIITTMILTAIITLLYYVIISLINVLHSQERHNTKSLFFIDITLIIHTLTPILILTYL